MQALADSDRPTPSEKDFDINDVVLAFHGTLLYEARVLTVHRDADEQVTSYTVHFQGWRKSWDETVPKDRVFEHNDDNLRVAHRLLNGAKMRQQALQPVHSEKDDLANKPAVPDASPANALFQIPQALQRQLVDDWEFVTKERRLVRLPREMNVQEVLNKWVSSRRQSTDKPTREVAEGLQTYFDAALPKLLLYRFERHQYNQFFHTGGARDRTLLPSAVYGAEHLLRLLVKLPYLLESTEVERDMMGMIADRANELCKYLQKNGRVIFLSEYSVAPPEYLKEVAELHQD